MTAEIEALLEDMHQATLAADFNTLAALAPAAEVATQLLDPRQDRRACDGLQLWRSATPIASTRHCGVCGPDGGGWPKARHRSWPAHLWPQWPDRSN